jgi:hypothetical protein
MMAIKKRPPKGALLGLNEQGDQFKNRTIFYKHRLPRNSICESSLMVLMLPAATGTATILRCLDNSIKKTPDEALIRAVFVRLHQFMVVSSYSKACGDDCDTGHASGHWANACLNNQNSPRHTLATGVCCAVFPISGWGAFSVVRPNAH